MIAHRRGICGRNAGWRVAALCAAAMAVCTIAAGEDWPTYRHDNARSNATSEQLSAPLQLEWAFTPPLPPEPAWTDPAKEKARVRFDETYHVAAVGDAVYFGSSADGKVYCLDAATGGPRWEAFTGGPVRVAPAVADGKVYVGSDDGYAYCFRADGGSLVWKRRAAHRDDKLLGSGKMISRWPIRTGVLVEGGTAYFGSGVFPHETTFLWAVDANDGALRWQNDSFGQAGYKLEFGGISPQGALLATENTLFVPSGRAMPAAFNRDTGALEYYCSPGGKIGGTWVLLTGSQLIAGTEGKRAYDTASGKQAYDNAYAWFPGLHLVVTEKYAYMLKFDELCALDRAAFRAASEWRDRIVAEQKPLTDEQNALKKKEAQASADELGAIQARLASLTKQIDHLAQERQRVEDGVHRWRRPCPAPHALMLAGDTLFVGGDDCVMAVDAATGDDRWTAPVQGMACGLAAANGRLLVSTDTGRIHCFTAKGEAAREVAPALTATPYPEDALTPLYEAAAQEILAATGVTKGYCLVYGCGEGRLAYELAKRTELKIVGIDPDPEAVAAARQAFDKAGLYGTRASFDASPLSALPYASYFANLIVSDRMLTSGLVDAAPDELYRVLKPHGGRICLGRPAPALSPLDVSIATAWLASIDPPPKTSSDGRWVMLERGPLEGAGAWTHQYADTANTACSGDRRVSGPLGVLWFGEPGPERMVERHARAAAPLALDGRLFVQGENLVMAYDSYNGVLLWQRAIPGALRVRVDSDMSNMAVQPEGLYVATGAQCLRLDPATGATLATYAVPPRADGAPARWGYLACQGDTVFGSRAKPLDREYGASWWQKVAGDAETAPSVEQTAELLAEDPGVNNRAFWDAQRNGSLWHGMTSFPAWGSVRSPQGAVTERIMASDAFFALDRDSGDVRWIREAGDIAHPAIAIADNTVFLAECSVSDAERAAAIEQREALVSTGVVEKSETHYESEHADVRRVLALDAATGAPRWDRVIDLTECGGDRMGLAYTHNLVFFFGCFSNHDRGLFNDGALKWRRITAVAAEDGRCVWSRPLNYLRRPVIMGDTILIEPRACDARTGAIKTRPHPLTGQDEEWEFVRPGHCCSITSASADMFFLRGYFLWYYDTVRDQGMLPFGGIRPGCWINLLPADGLLLFPEASAGCTCSYPIRTSVAMAPKAEYTTWALNVQHGAQKPVKHMAVNFGAPGDWRADDGTLWFSYPHPPSTSWQTYGVDFSLNEQFAGEPDYFRREFKGFVSAGASAAAQAQPWIFASGCRGLTACRVPLLDAGQGPATYTVRLYFVDTEIGEPGGRVFDVKLQGHTVAEGFDIAAEAGGADAGLVKEFRGIEVDTDLAIEFVPAPGTAPPVLNGLEVIREATKMAAR
ncbi:MAG: PQQ-binding-like beta-propeller repeat protein [Candidatus Hydrogenedentes bacterium]|nr:PQQ-binding-like beta-propeller repeat protein [Candidatus Hydrogenedentota bacterium]